MPTVYIRQDLYIRIIKTGLDPTAYVNSVVAAAMDIATPTTTHEEKQDKLIKAAKAKKGEN